MKKNKPLKVLFATTNSAKVQRLINFLNNPSISIVSLKELGYELQEPEESGKNGVENAEIKAKYYWENLREKLPVITQDDTINLEGVDPADNPGTELKKPVIEKYGDVSDEHVIEYYSNLAAKYGGTIPMKLIYGHAICHEGNVEGRQSELTTRLTSIPSPITSLGYALVSVMQVNINGQWLYYSELTEKQQTEIDAPLGKSVNYLIHKYISINK